MKSTLETIAFFKNLRPTLDELSDEEAGALMKALFAFDDGEVPDLTGKSTTVKALFPLVAETLDRLTKNRMSKVRPQTDRKSPANAPQIDRKSPAHNHNHNHPSIEGYIGRNKKVQSAFGFSTERTDVDYNELAKQNYWKEN